MELKVLDEIPYSRFRHMDVDELAGMVHHIISANVKEHSYLKQEHVEFSLQDNCSKK